MVIKRARFIYLLPLIVVESYLLFTLALLYYGPITWRLHNVTLFWFLICAYHISFIMGYLYVVNKYGAKYIEGSKATTKVNKFVLKYFWGIWILALVASLIMYKNGVNNSTVIPFNIFEKISTGLNNFAVARGDFNHSYMNNPENSVLVTFFYAVTALFRYSLLPITILLWSKLSTCKKIFGLALGFFPITISLSTGTNSYTIFIFIQLLLSLCIIILRKCYMREKIKHFKLALIFLCCLSFGCVAVFLTVMSARMPVTSLYSLEKASPLGDVTFSNTIKVSSFDAALSKIDFYLVQGYYGMSLALSKDFTPTYGVGSSLFVISFLDKHFGADLNSKTYQHKVNSEWNEYALWHSFYSQVANDFSFYGLIILMFFIGIVFASVYISILIYNDLLAKILFTIFGIMFLFMPMNNQVFNNMELLIAFSLLLVLWGKKKFKL
ncbi:hypothetical protein [Cysteiniphilum sp. QT6929]|uniref:hypothetical protein n=1 Tax=Cysteiniphilum sp. QT6929 TaxID=2975055 RepID=UPI0024B3661B|nr:hypothetical protein [Cysteiniphilum sp. QT6929]WHN66364.1 hypothetical protein NYP54_03805 [Cysteiniphilum sp. QT6929]